MYSEPYLAGIGFNNERSPYLDRPNYMYVEKMTLRPNNHKIARS